MSDKESKNSEENQTKAEEPSTAFKTVRIFNSFEEQSEHTAKMRAEMSYDERMENIEALRKRVFHEHLLPDNKWPSISKKFEIMVPYVSETGQ